MAQRTPRPARGAQPARASAKSKRTTTTDVEVVEEAPGLGLDAGIAVMTAVVLIAALVLLDMMQGRNGDALFFN